MKTTKILSLAALTLIATSAGAHQAFAADGGEMNSVGTITYVADTDPTNPLDPMNPDATNPYSPTDPDHQNPTAGPLSIDYVSNFRFGEQKSTGKDMTYTAHLDTLKQQNGDGTVDVPNFVQVTDNRGTNAGWHLTVTEDAQFKNGTSDLTGAELKLDHATLNSADGGTAPTATSTLTLTPGQASDVVDAKADQGTGTWSDRFGTDAEEGKSSVSLSVPGETKKVQGEYKTSLTWTLTDTPA